MNEVYRKCVGVVVYRDHKVLLCERRDFKDGWQFPQGGVEEDESLIDAARRELREETSITSVEVADRIETPLRYAFPPQIKKGRKWMYDGQDVQWVLFRFTGNDHEIDVHTQEPEFSRWAWVDIDEAPKKIVEFKKNVYNEVVKKFKPVVEG